MFANDALHLLLIEDNPADARYIEESLREATNSFVRASNRGNLIERDREREEFPPIIFFHETTLQAGIERLNSTVNFDILLLDLHLRDSRGLDTLSTMAQYTQIPILVLTGIRDQETGRKAIRGRADDYLVKDEINGELLIRSISHAIERRTYERDLRRFETLMKVSTDINAIIDPAGDIQYVTPSVKYILGYTPDDLIHENVFAYIHPDDRDKARRAFRAVIEYEDYPPIEFRIEHANGSWIILESRGINLLDDPLIAGIVVYTHDITMRVEREQRLERFASVVSHDLRNPLGIAQMYLQMIRDGGGSSTEFDHVERSLARMETIIDTLLTMARKGRAIDERKPVSLTSVIDRAWWQVDTFDATLDLDEGLGMIFADGERIQTVFENLFRNAIEHGGHEVNIRVEWLDDGFAIEDTGPGIPPGVKDEMFEFGYSTGGGTGVGLAIVREIVEAHGWKINVVDASDGGARFEIRGIVDDPIE